MSKAFTSEENEDEELPAPEAPSLPSGAKNYITPEGARCLRQELEALKESLPRDKDALDQKYKRAKARIAYLEQRISTLVEQSSSPLDTIRFGHHVVLADAKGHEEIYRIVGVDEVDLEHGSISWVSPLAQVLLGKKKGDSVTLAGRTLQIHQIKA